MSNKIESQLLPATNQVLYGILLFSIGVFCMSVMDAGAKWLTATYAVIQLIFFDSIFGSIPMVVALRKEGFSTLKTRKWYLLIGRGFLTVGTMFFFFTALKYLPLADVTIIFLVVPLLTTLLSAVLLKEQVALSQIMAIIVGLAGAVLIIRPGGVNFQLVMLLPLAAAVMAALGLVASKVL
ncbi:MAG: DMT family transporter, partial [Pseudomonadota bacterium]